ncbi:class I SAM-dependent methyltransferase [Gordonia sp. ABSL49_1]|uniref:class I SAM-dependent methyltransferase n=1 Tax=unclassified Gordonia (in: high G+C Gram-positive bacteria) TaxID=2657482 RepID=UPI001F0F3B8B|nr:class I SAM-dependent methyltransferase [Gordonia sp. ABSL49_1]MCH5644176.1 methyltransferase domain-containing protein [Gordonia sp. ABSL49_1]
MGFYDTHVLPRLINLVCGIGAIRPSRDRACEGLHGRVVELGFGSGHNVESYPDAVTRVDAVEPSDLGWKLAHDRVSASPIHIERSGLDGEHLPFDDDTFDCALSTYTLCTIPDLPLALAEVRRVLKPGGTLHFLEHGLAPDEKVRRWQHRLDPLQQRLAGGCHLNRDIPQILTDAGFVVERLDTFYQPHAAKSSNAMSRGVATPR